MSSVAATASADQVFEAVEISNECAVQAVVATDEQPSVIIQDPALAAAMAEVPVPLTFAAAAVAVAKAPVARRPKQQLPFSLDSWIQEALHSTKQHSRCAARRRLRFVHLNGESPAAQDTRRARNERVGEASWFEFESKKVDSVVKLVRQIVANLTPFAKSASKVYLSGNLATRASLWNLVGSDEAAGVVMQAFPPSIINVTVSVSDPRVIGDVCYAVDTAMAALKRHMDSGPDASMASVNSCLVMQSAVPGKGGVMIDVPRIGEHYLPSTAYSICKNVSNARFIMTRLRRFVPDGSGGIQVPMVDVTIHNESPPPLVRVALGSGSVLAQKAEFLEAYFTGLVNDPEVKESGAKMARCSAALSALRFLRGVQQLPADAHGAGDYAPEVEHAGEGSPEVEAAPAFNDGDLGELEDGVSALSVDDGAVFI